MSKREDDKIRGKTSISALVLLILCSGCIGGDAPHETTAPPVVKTTPTFPPELLEAQLELLLMGLAYDRDAADVIAKEIVSWEDEDGNPSIGTWEGELIDTREKYKDGNITADELTERETWITLELARRIKKEVPVYNVSSWHLGLVTNNNGANCVGYTQLFYVLGDAIGLEVRPIEVVESKDLREGHVTDIVRLSDNRTVMIELTSNTAYVSQPFSLSEEYAKSGNYLEHQDKYSSIFPHTRIRTIDKDGLLASLFISRAYNFNALGEFEKAMAEYIVAIELDPEYALAYNNRGAVLHRLGYLADALADLNMAVDLDPELANAYSNRGVVHSEIGNYSEAISDLNRAIAMGRGTAVNYNNRGISYSRQGEHRDAVSDFNMATTLDPGFAKAYFGSGYAYSALGNYTKAVSEYTKAIELEDNYFEAYTNRGAVYSVLKNYTGAADDYTRALELDPQNAVIYYNRGNANYNLGNYSGAVSDYTRAITIDSYFADAYNNRGNAKKWLGDKEGAENDFEVAGRLDETLKR